MLMEADYRSVSEFDKFISLLPQACCVLLSYISPTLGLRFRLLFVRFSLSRLLLLLIADTAHTDCSLSVRRQLLLSTRVSEKSLKS